MLKILDPLYEAMKHGETLREVAFKQAFSHDIDAAFGHIAEYRHTGLDDYLNKAWNVFYDVFRKINKQLPNLTTLELQYVSPRLLEATELALAVPGTSFSCDWIQQDQLAGHFDT